MNKFQRNYADDLNRAAFENFDDDTYDPSVETFDPEMNNYDSYRRQRGPRPAGTKIQTSPARREVGGRTPDAQFDITITSTNTVAANIEMFNAQNTIAEFLNAQTNPTSEPALAGHVLAYRNGAGTAQNTAVVYGQEVTQGGVGTGDVVYWNKNGDLVYTYDAIGYGTGNVTISCKQIPYRSLVKYSERGSFKISKMRMKFSTSTQINQDITWKQKTFLGSTKSNTVSVSSYFRPDQFQSLLVDVPVPLSIDAEKGLFYTVEANETVLINMFISNYTKSAI